MLFIKYSDFFYLESSSIDSSSSLSLSSSEEKELSSGMKLTIFLNFFCIVTALRIFKRNSSFLILQIESSTVKTTHAQLTFPLSTFLLKKICVAFTVIILQFILQIFFFENQLSMKCFFYNVAHLIPNFIIFF